MPSNEIAPTPPAPPSLRPAQTISPEQLQAELRGGPPAQPQERTHIQPPVQVDPKDRGGDAARTIKAPDWKSSMRDRVVKTPDAIAKAEADAAKTKAAEVAAKAEADAKKAAADAAKPAATTDDAAKADAAKKPDADNEEAPADQLQVLPHDKPPTAKRIKTFLRNEAKLKSEVEAARKEVETLKKAPKTEANVEELDRLRNEHKAAQEDLMRFRRRYELESDPEIKTKYDEPVAHAETTIEAALKKRGYGESTLNAIKEEGGFAAFSRSMKTFPITVTDENGETSVVHKTAAELAVSWLGSMPIADSELVRQAVGKQEALKAEKRLTVERSTAEAKQYFENQTAAQRKAGEEQAATQKKAAEEFSKWSEKTVAETEFLKDREVPASATDAEKNEITAHNEFTKSLRSSLNKHPTNTAEYSQLKLDAAEAQYLRRTVGSKDAEIAALREQLSSAKGAMRTTTRAGSILKGESKPEGGANKGDPTDFKLGLRKRLLGESADE